MTDIEHAQWIRQFWHDKSNEIKTDLNEAVRIAYQQGRKDALEEVRAEIEELDRYFDNDYFSGNRDAMFKCNEVLQIIDKYKGE